MKIKLKTGKELFLDFYSYYSYQTSVGLLVKFSYIQKKTNKLITVSHLNGTTEVIATLDGGSFLEHSYLHPNEKVFNRKFGKAQAFKNLLKIREFRSRLTKEESKEIWTILLKDKAELIKTSKKIPKKKTLKCPKGTEI